MSTTAPFLDSFVFQVRYAYGFAYYDRCGQTLLDIERLGRGWVAGQPTLQTGVMENAPLRAAIAFGPEQFDFTASHTSGEQHVGKLVADAHAIWQMIENNLGLNEFVRVACRLQWLVSKDAIEQAESVLARAPLNVTFPAQWQESGFRPIRRNSTIVLQKDRTEFRVALQAVTRLQGNSPSTLVQTDPRLLPKHRRDARLAALKARREYDSNPMHAVNLDVDAVEYDPPRVNPTTFIRQQIEIATATFVPMLGDL